MTRDIGKIVYILKMSEVTIGLPFLAVKRLAVKRKRFLKDQQVFKVKRLAKTDSLFATVSITSSESESETTLEEPGFAFTESAVAPSTSKKSPLSEGIPSGAYLIADKYGLSNRALTELAGIFQKSAGKNLDLLNLSVNTTRRRKSNFRKSTAADILQSQLGNVGQKRFAFHRDGKLIKSLTHVVNDVERVAVLLTGTQ